MQLVDRGQSDQFVALNMPGGKPISQVKQPESKKPLIVEMKDIPNFSESQHNDQIVLILEVDKEASAKNIDLDVSATELKLKSENYAFNYKFKFRVDPDSVNAKFSKVKKTLTLTFAKI